MVRRGKLTAHELVRPAMTSLLVRIESDARRVVGQHDDEEAVHDFRVGLRRLRTMLRASRRLYGKTKVKRLEAAAKAFGDATSALRDAEVLDDTLRLAALDAHAQTVAAAWLGEVKAREADLRAGAVALINGPELAAMCTAARKMIAVEPKRNHAVSDYADDRFDDVRDGVRELLPVQGSDIERLHKLRIRFKRVRYTCEMLAQFMHVVDATGTRKKHRARALAAAGRFAESARLAARMQKELGLLHDADQAIIGLGRATMSDDDRAAVERALLALRARLVSRSLTLLAKVPDSIVGSGPVVVTGETPLRARP